MAGAACGAAVACALPAPIESIDGAVLSIKSDKLGAVKIALTGNAAVFGVTKGDARRPQAGRLYRRRRHAAGRRQPARHPGDGVCAGAARARRGLPALERRPNSTMTNGAVAETVGGVDGPMLTVKYKDGEKKIVVPPEAVILAYVVGDKSELKAGAHVAMVRALKKPDGSLEANRINVGRGDVVPR